MVELFYAQDLIPDQSWRSPARTVVASDVHGFACLTGDFNPLHVDHHESQDGLFGEPVAHGLLGLALAIGLSSQCPRVATLSLLDVVNWEFHQPIRFGDTLHAWTRVVEVELRARGRRAVVTWHRDLRNHDDTLVQSGRTRTLVRGRSAN